LHYPREMASRDRQRRGIVRGELTALARGRAAERGSALAPIVRHVAVECPPRKVFGYVTSPSRFCEWQAGVVSGRFVGDGAPAVGTMLEVTRQIAGSRRTATLVISAISPPRSWVLRGVDGLLRATVDVRVDPRHDGQHSDITISVSFTGHGIGRLLLPMAVWMARRRARQNCRKLRQRLESRLAP